MLDWTKQARAERNLEGKGTERRGRGKEQEIERERKRENVSTCEKKERERETQAETWKFIRAMPPICAREKRICFDEKNERKSVYKKEIVIRKLGNVPGRIIVRAKARNLRRIIN